MEPIREEKIAISYHRGFGLVRAAVAAVLRSLTEGNTRKQAEADLTLGPDQFTAAINYCERSGLIYQEKPTAFGLAALEHDSSLSESATQWAMHYFLSSPAINAPNYWANLTLNNLTLLGQLGQAQIGIAINEYSQEVSGWEPSDRTIKAGATAYVSTYGKEDGFGSLGILEETNVRHQYSVRQPRALSVGAFACLLADFWQRYWPDRSDIVLEQITQGELARVLLLSENKVNDLLGSLAAPDVALIKRQRKHLPYQIIRQPGLDAAMLWETHLYR
ncbi:DUF4007 family protein [Hymenobacter jejuensis]|uniref:DUF4007 family protein n=1 Tax=Hymenobacter jejuensis TaxID=2502781 RepID=A0A5B7ZYT2_9BACT|nr:DUF4007 family protein [Hymenobacter jejuensis]QDA59999.1 DUF4007 family protein [Hymenobacter jejuensis]